VQDASVWSNSTAVAEDDEDDEGEGNWRPMCRICYEHEASDLFAPCRCAGSMAFVHRECLRKWRAVSVGERGFSHCTMCGFQYVLTTDASLPPTSALHSLLRSLAVGECAVIATILCLMTAIGGEVVEFLLNRAPAASTVVRTMRRLLRLARVSGPGADEGGGGAESEAPFSPVRERDPETQVLRRVGFNWAILTALCVGACAVPALGGLGEMAEKWVLFARFVIEEADIPSAMTSMMVWWMVYALCEVFFVHLHVFPKALTATLGLYFAVGIASMAIQWALQLYVLEQEQPSTGDVLNVDELSLADTGA